MKEESNGIVYVLINEAMPGYVKIGKTSTSIEQRILELSRSSAVPLPFECYYAAKVKDVNQVEAALHDAFGDHRINPRREFFELSPERVIAVLKLLAIEDVTPSRNAGVESKEDAVALEAARKRKAAFNFRMVEIPAGSELMFIRDENMVCTVAADQKHVEFQGETLSLSDLSQKLLKVNWPAQGPLYWTYEGETLDERRRRFEENGGFTNEEIEAAGDRWMQQEEDIARGK